MKELLCRYFYAAARTTSVILGSPMRGLRLGLLLVAVMSNGPFVDAREPARFNVPAGDAKQTLKLAAEQGEIDLLYNSSIVEGVRTKRIKGRFSVSEAFGKMLEDTRLSLYEDPQSSTYAIVATEDSSALEPPSSEQSEPIKTDYPQMQEMTRNKTLLKKISQGVLGILLASGAAAQDDTDESEDEVYSLSPFVVDASGDTGYTAVSTLAGGRLATRIEDTPSSLQALTAEFLEDVAADDFVQATQFALNATHEHATNGISIFNDYAVNFRGLGNVFQARNYFQWYINSDNYSSERLEYARGPNSIVFGDSGVGGISNINTKRAHSNPASEVTIQFNSWGGGRSTVDFNRPVGEKLYVRVAGMLNHSDNWRNQSSFDREGFFFTTTWRPFEKTEMRFEYETGSNEQFYGSVLLDRVSEWDGVTTISEPMESGTAGGGAVRRQNNDYLVWTPSEPELGIQNLRNWGFTRAAGNQPTGFTEDSPFQSARYPVLLDQRFNFQAPNRSVDMDFDTYTFFVDHQFGDNFFVEAAFNHTINERDIDRVFWDNYQIDVNEFMPDGVTPNPHFLEHYADANPFEDIQTNTHDHYRLSAAYILRRQNMKHRFLASWQLREADFEGMEFRHSRTNGSIARLDNSRNRIRIRRYESQLGDDFSFGTSDSISGIDVERWKRRHFGNVKDLQTYQFAVSSSWFNNERFTTILGARKDDLTIDGYSQVVDPDTREVTGLTPLTRDNDSAQTTYTAGGVYDVNNWFSLVANYGESFQPQSGDRIDINGDRIDVLLSEGTDFGMRFRFFEGKLFASISHYDNTQFNQDTGGASGNINGIWNIIEDNLGQDTASLRVPDGYRSTFIQEGDGWEFETAGNINDNWRMLFNYSIPDTAQRDAFIGTRAYLEANRAAWSASASELDNLGLVDEAADIRDNIGDIENRLLGFAEGRPLNGDHKYLANFYTQYNWAEGGLKGFYAGTGVNFRGKRLAANMPGDAFDFVYSPSYHLHNLTLGYKGKLFEKNVTLQLNVDNLLGEDQVHVKNSARMRTVTVEGETLVLPQQVFFTAERRYRLTARFRF